MTLNGDVTHQLTLHSFSEARCVNEGRRILSAVRR